MRAHASLLLLLTLILSGCSGEDISDRYQAEREFFRVESRYLKLSADSSTPNTNRLRGLATDFEAVAARIPTGTGDSRSMQVGLRHIEAKAWLRAIDCHTALLDSGRAELILATMAANYAEYPQIIGEVALRQGRIAESHGQYGAAISQFTNVITFIAPDPGPEPGAQPDPEAPPEEDTAADFVMQLPLHIARIAIRDTSLADPSVYYTRARGYYADQAQGESDFVRVEATYFLSEIEADLGNWRKSSTILDRLELEIPTLRLMVREPGEIRLASFSHQVRARTWGETGGDSVRVLLQRLIEDYPLGRASPTALLLMANGAAELGETDEALGYLRRLRRDYPTSEVVPEAELTRGLLLERADRWPEARKVLRALPFEFPMATAALRAPLEIAAHYRRAGDPISESEALVRAERNYREILQRYPTGSHSFFTREKLIQTLTLQGRHAEALDEILAMCDETAAPTQRPGLLVSAAHIAEIQLGEPARAAAILERVGEEFPNTRIGRWSVREARRLREQRSR